MKNLFLITTLTLLFFQSCKHDVCPPEISLPNIGFVTSPGSYWVYQWYDIDTAENETIRDTRDSVYISGDTVINNATYTIYKGTYLGDPSLRFLRDSAGVIVSSNGMKYWDKNDLGELSYFENQDFNSRTSMTNLSVPVTLPSGIFTAIEKTKVACLTNGKPFSPCQQCKNLKLYYVEGVGEVLEENSYVGSCNKLEKRLVKYEIK